VHHADQVLHGGQVAVQVRLADRDAIRQNGVAIKTSVAQVHTVVDQAAVQVRLGDVILAVQVLTVADRAAIRQHNGVAIKISVAQVHTVVDQAADPVLTAEALALARIGENPIVLRLKDRPKVAMQKAMAGTDVLTLAVVAMQKAMAGTDVLTLAVVAMQKAMVGTDVLTLADHRSLAKP
jgi:hypothetical protein